MKNEIRACQFKRSFFVAVAFTLALVGCGGGGGSAPAGSTPNGATPTVTAISTTSGAAGTVVIITGTNFNTIPANNTIKFNGTQATVTAATATSLNVTVPVGATTGTISVTTANGTATSAGSFTVSAGGGGTAAQYFSKNAVGNTWSWLMTETGLPNSTMTSTITANKSGVVTFSDPTVSTNTSTEQIDATGAWISTDNSTGITSLMLPATFSVGSTWVMDPATTTSGATNATVAAFNVKRTVPAGIFTDCLQIDWTSTFTSGGITSSSSFSEYYSPSAGTFVDVSGTITDTGFPSAILTTQLQAGYIANGTSGGTGNVPTITGMSLASGIAGTVVTITGANFDTTSANNTIKFNGIQATVTAATTTLLTVAVPVGATTGTVSVTTAGGTATSSDSFTVSSADSILTFTGSLNFSEGMMTNSLMRNDDYAIGPVNESNTSLGMVDGKSSIIYTSLRRYEREFISWGGVTYYHLTIDEDTITQTTMLRFSGVKNDNSASYSMNASCVVGSGPTPSCASVGINVDRSNGSISFSNTPMFLGTQNTTTPTFTLTGTLTFTPF